MFWFKKKDNNDNRITFREWYDKHYKENNVLYTVIVQPTGYKLCYKVSHREYKLDYETIAKYGNRKVVHEFLVVTRRCSNEWIVILGGK